MERKLSQLGPLDEDSGRFPKPIEGTGTFLDTVGHVASPLNDLRSRPNQEEDGLMEVGRQMEPIPLSTEFTDDEIANVLFGDFEEGDFEKLPGFEFVNQSLTNSSWMQPNNQKMEKKRRFSTTTSIFV